MKRNRGSIHCAFPTPASLFSTITAAHPFTLDIRVAPFTVALAEKTIDLCTKVNITLPDAVIAASALSLDATLVTRNERNFDQVPDLVIYNPCSKTS